MSRVGVSRRPTSRLFLSWNARTYTHAVLISVLTLTDRIKCLPSSSSPLRRRRLPSFRTCTTRTPHRAESVPRPGADPRILLTGSSS